MHFPLVLTFPLMAQSGDGGREPNAEVSIASEVCGWTVKRPYIFACQLC